MVAPTLYVSITNHGFGHATRAAAVAATVNALAPDVDLILATTAPKWLLDEYLPVEYEYRPVALDIGVIQADSLTMDLPATLAKLDQIRADAARLIATEATYLKQRGVSLVLADIPPLAVPLAQAAGVPCWMMSNFGWDFIYRAFGDEFAATVAWIEGWFGQCDRLFRLPFHEPMAAFPVIEDVGLTGGNPRYSVAALREQLGIQTPPERTVLLTFGGLGLQAIPYDPLSHFPDWQFLTFDQAIPNLPNLRPIPRQGFRPVDVMPLCGRMVSKPGFSTFSEACRLGLPVITITREDFAEGPVLVNGLQDHSWHRVLPPNELFRGDWAFLTEPLHPPRKTLTLSKEGNRQIAEAVVDYLLSLE
ncbi:glycosyl transferase [Phormidium sp. FACHB-1136]|uniref:glycosyl transferase n=1 Tax=Phormidium sp. FACHB-1136 TaxID=2692848 RepID=UPI0016893369|nr:glycosyl transferase [Phormidium sp. FACHB-1136]MBD2428537.1 glycosyl transferase [Phormidium sp. FACHB-1136]